MAIGTLISRLRSDEGQMSVELAVTMPVLLALAIIVVDVGVFLGDCARFDRAVPQVVRVYAASPDSSAYANSDVLREIEAELTEVMGGSQRLEIEVVCEGTLAGGSGALGASLSFVPQPQRYTCTLTFMPWPFTFGAFGVVPVEMSHSTSYCVDPYRPGGLI